MENRDLQNQFKTAQYNNQANLVYINTMILCAFLVIFFYFSVGSTLVAILNLIAVGVSGLAIWLNRKHHYELSALLYIGYVSIIALIQGVHFGLNSGYPYYFFNMSGLIMYSSWKSWQKVIGLTSEFILFIILFIMAYDQIPLIHLSYGYMFFLHTLNILLNIAGVANSANYYIGIATKSHNKVLNLAIKDYLTNIMNRTAFDDFIVNTFKMREKHHQHLGILFLDIDHFKVVNDTFGHLCGDEILKQFAAILSQNVRTGDFVARYGGEEFVIVSVLENPEQLSQLGERLRQGIEAYLFKCSEREIRITVSIGALYIHGNAKLESHVALDKTDQLLYQAKSEGRNRVVLKVLE